MRFCVCVVFMLISVASYAQVDTLISNDSRLKFVSDEKEVSKRILLFEGKKYTGFTTSSYDGKVEITTYLDGLCIENNIFQDKKLEMKILYKNSKSYYETYKNETLHTTYTADENGKNGECITYFYNGKISSKKNYVNGFLRGNSYFYNTSQDTLFVVHFDNYIPKTILSDIKYVDINQLKCERINQEESYSDCKNLDGSSFSGLVKISENTCIIVEDSSPFLQIIFQNNALFSVCFLQENQRHGYYYQLHSNQNIAISGHYRKGKESDYWIYFDENSNHIRCENKDNPELQCRYEEN